MHAMLSRLSVRTINGAPSAARGAPQPPGERADRALAVTGARRGRLGRHLHLPGEPRRVERHRLGDALELGLAAAVDLELVREARPGLAGDQDRVVGLAGMGLDPGGDVDGVADDREVEPAGAADRARDHVAAVDADPDPQLAGRAALVDGRADLAGGAHRPVGVVGERLGGAEDGDQAVALELVDVAAVARR